MPDLAELSARPRRSRLDDLLDAVSDSVAGVLPLSIRVEVAVETNPDLPPGTVRIVLQPGVEIGRL